MRESELLQHIYDRSKGLPPHILVGPGDDSAILRVGDQRLVLTTDQLVESRHYDPGKTPLELIARKAVARSLSDLAAMAADPIAGLATAAIGPRSPDPDQLFDEMARIAAAYNAPLVGGDISAVDGPTVLTVTLLGLLPDGRHAPLRSGAQPGDAVYVTGRVGGAVHSGRHLTFEPRLSEARFLAEALAERLHAMIDLSDGLGRDAARIATASNARIEIDASSVPLHDDATDMLSALSEGEDYELLFTAPADVPDSCAETGVPITRIGAVSEGAGCAIRLPTGEYIDATDLGYDHTS